MQKILTLIAAALISIPAAADQHGGAEAEVRDAVNAFNSTYASNDVKGYFNHFADDADMFWGGGRQSKSAYHEEWVATIKAGGAVEKSDVSELQVKVLPGGNSAHASYYIDYRFRNPDGDVVVEKAFESETWQKIDGQWKIVGLHYTILE